MRRVCIDSRLPENIHSVPSPLVIADHQVDVTVFRELMNIIQFQIIHFHIRITIGYTIAGVDCILLTVDRVIMDILTIVSTAGHTGYIECQVIAFSDMPGGTKTSEPVIILSFGVVGLVEKTVVRRIQTTGDASSFKLTVTVIQISISIHFTTAVINVATRLIPTIRIGSDFHASVITGFPVILQYNIDNTGCTLRAISGRRVGNNFYLLDISGRHHIQNIRLVISC